MDSEIVLAPARVMPAKATECAAVVATAAPATIHHFTVYGRGTPQDISAFASAKVLLEGAIAAAQHGAANGVSKAGRGRRHYIVRLVAGGRISGTEVETNLETVSPLLGSMSVRHLPTDEYGQFGRTKRSQAEIVFEVRPPRQPRSDMAIASSSVGLRTRGAFDFTVVNGSVTHCEWIPSSGPDNISG